MTRSVPQTPERVPVTVRISATDWAPDGNTEIDAVEIAHAFIRHGAAALDVSSGQVVKDEAPAYGRSYQTPFADRIRQEVAAPAGVAVIAVGAISSHDDVNSILLAGRADLCALARAHLYNPQWTLQAAAEQRYTGDGAIWPQQWQAGSRRPPTSRTDKVAPRLALLREPEADDVHVRWITTTRQDAGVTPSVAPQPANQRPGPSQAERRTQSRTVVVTFLGAIVRRFDDWMPVAGAIELMAPLGLDGPSVRTAISRLKKRGWLEPEMRAGVRGYALTASALGALAAGDEVIWHTRQPAQLADGWCVVHFSVPESARRERHQLRTHLAAIGFGNVGTALWIAPSRMRAAGERAIAELGLTTYSAVFVGDHVSGQPLEKLVYQSWDLAEIDRGYRGFTATYESLATRLATAADEFEPRDAFVTYVGVVDRWRRLPFRDPGLPRELLAEDWHGPAAGALFEKIVLRLEPLALDYAAGRWPQQQSA